MSALIMYDDKSVFLIDREKVISFQVTDLADVTGLHKEQFIYVSIDEIFVFEKITGKALKLLINLFPIHREARIILSVHVKF